ncbi:MAG: 3-deoxy-manno-octulosonate cytidylyltransferase [Pseudomonadota bacterium]|jgi:3-deoxy-manno-octulosonate cytidylyltransferase (CMP-KDO synthetase)
MRHSDSVVIIPARIGSTRLPKKMLADINGMPLITRTMSKLIGENVCDVFVATDSEEIAQAVEIAGGNAIMTDPELQSGTDRVYAAYKKLSKQYDYIVNVQGDMPNIKPNTVWQVLSLVKNNPFVDISTAVCKFPVSDEVAKSNIVKAVISNSESSNNLNKALYFSRSQIPYGSDYYYYHLGLYGYNKDSLKKFVSLKPSTLEQTEKLEQLRAMENGMSIYCVEVGTFPISVDVPEDLDQARKEIL